jgi:ankyrin repeat protein
MSLSNDIIQKLSQHTDDRTLLNLLSTNKKIYNDEKLLRSIYIQRYPQLVNLQTWRERLLETIKEISELREKYNFDYYRYNMGDPKKQLNIFKGIRDSRNMSFVITKASIKGELALVKFALDNGASIHTGNDSPLILASGYGHLNVVKYLLENGARIHVDNDYALMTAAEKGHFDVVKYLVEKDANIHANHDAAEREARRNGHLDIANYLSSL